MKKILLSIVSLTILWVIALQIQQAPGHVLISLGNWRLETNLWLALFSVVLLVLIVQMLLKSIHLIHRGIAHIHSLFKPGMSPQNAKKEFAKGMQALILGHWTLAETALSKAAAYCDHPLLAYAGAAYAAISLGRNPEHYFLAARKNCPKDTEIILIIQAILTRRYRDPTAVSAILSLLNKNAELPAALLLKLELAEEREDWVTCLALIPKLRRTHAAPVEQLLAMERQAVTMILDDLTLDLDTRTSAWEGLSSMQQTQPEMVAAYAHFLDEQEQPDKALSILRKALKRSWHPSLIDTFGQICGSHPSKQLEIVLAWLEQRHHEPSLTLCLARTYAMNKMWTESAKLFEEALQNLSDRAEIWLELAIVYRAAGQLEQANHAEDRARTHLLEIH